MMFTLLYFLSTGCQLVSDNQSLARAKTKKGSDARPNDNDACHDLRLAFPSINGASAEHNVSSFF